MFSVASRLQMGKKNKNKKLTFENFLVILTHYVKFYFSVTTQSTGYKLPAFKNYSARNR